MRPELEDMTQVDAKKMVAQIIRRKKVTDMKELEVSFRRSVESSGQSVKSVLKSAIKILQSDGKVKVNRRVKDVRLTYKPQKA